MGLWQRLTTSLDLVNHEATMGIESPWADNSQLEQITLTNLYPDVDWQATFGLNRDGAMKIAAAAKARKLICETIAGMPIDVFKGAKPLSISDHPALITQPELGRARVNTIAWTMDELLWHGKAWWRITDREFDGRPKHVRLELNAHVQYNPDSNTVTVPSGTYQWKDFIYFEALHEGVLTYGKDVLSRAALIEMAAAKASNNPVPSIELHQVDGEPLTAEEVDILVQRYIKARASATGGVSYTPASVETKIHGVPAEQLLIDGRNAMALDVARAIGVPAWAVDASVAGSSLTYSNVPSRSRELLDYTLRSYMDVIAQRLSLDDVLPRGQWAQMNPSRLLMGDFADRMNAGKIAIEAGIYTAEEIRQMENGAPLEAN